MHRPIVWIPGAALLAVAIAALLVLGATSEPAAGRSAPRVVVRSPSQSAPTHEAARELGGPGAPEVVVLGELAPTRAARAPAPAPRGGATSRPQVVHEIVYVDAAPVSPAPMSIASPDPTAVAPAPEVAMDTQPAELPSTLPAPPPVQPAPAQRGPSRAGGIVTGAAIGAGIGAVLGGSRGALRGAIGGAAGRAIGGRCNTGSVYDLASLTP